MLVLTRKLSEKIVISGLEIEITVVQISRGKVRIGISAPAEVSIRRQEVSNPAQFAGVSEEV